MPKKNLLEAVRATAREPNPERFREPEALAPEPSPASSPSRPKKERVKKGRTAIPLGVSLFPPELDKLDRFVGRLQRAGYANANRSLVVREALQRLEEDTEGMSDDDCLSAFFKRAAKRRSA